MIDGSRILLVDDNPEIIQLLTDFLTPYNCEVFKASMGKEALETPPRGRLWKLLSST